MTEATIETEMLKQAKKLNVTANCFTRIDILALLYNT